MGIPKQLQTDGINFVLLERGGKKPFEKDWQNKRIKWNNENLQRHLDSGGNYGVMGGGSKKLIIVDFDDEQIQEEIVKKLPETFTVKTGSGLLHKYFFSDGVDSFKIFSENIDTLADVQGKGKQVVGAGSIHPNGNKYEVIEDKEIGFISYSELKAILIPFDKKPKKEESKKIEEGPKREDDYEDDFLDDLKRQVKVSDVLSWIGVDTSKNPTECPFHSSKGGKCLGFKEETAHCFHCDESWNIFSLVKQHKNCDFKEALEYLADIGGMSIELEESKKKYREWLVKKKDNKKETIKASFLNYISGEKKKWAEGTEILVDYVKEKLKIYTTQSDLKSEMWVYKEGVYVPEGKSEIKKVLRDLLGDWYSIFILNKVVEKIEPDTFIDADLFFNSCHKWEIPLENGILDIRELELRPFDNQQIFFNKLPVEYVPGETCPKIEEFLKEILSKPEDIDVFFEMVGFCLLKEYTYEKAFMLVGDGRNGKGKSLELIKRLVGVHNSCSIPLSALVPESFSISELKNKMVNLAGDISNTDLKDTSMFKSCTGRDLLGGKRKFLNDISFQNYSKFVFACNELPMVYDLTRGFWDRWILLEFPYTFVTQEEYDLSDDKEYLKIKDANIIEKISLKNEMSGFLNMALLGLHRLIENKRFSSSQGCEEVKSTWIRKSNSFIAFCYDCIEEDYDGQIKKKDLRKRFADYCKEHKISPKSDYVVKRVLQETYGASEDRLNPIGDSVWEWHWIGIKWK